MSNASSFSRRKFLAATGILTGTAALGGAALSLATAQAADAPHNATQHVAKAEDAAKAVKIPRGRMFFTDAQDFATLSEAAERIFPKDELGPGAKELGAPYFIDNQLAGAWGYNEREYMAGPFLPGAPTQGTQTPIQRRDLFLMGIKALNAQANTSFKKDFAKCADTEKDNVLSMCASGKIPMDGVSSTLFFDMLKSAVLAGVYADPIYMGNDGMQGWKMKQYPGAQMEYTTAIASDKFEVIAPQSLADMQ